MVSASRMGLLDILYVQSALRSIVLKLPSVAWPDTICMPWKCLRGIYLDTHARTHERKWYLQNIYNILQTKMPFYCVYVFVLGEQQYLHGPRIPNTQRFQWLSVRELLLREQILMVSECPERSAGLTTANPKQRHFPLAFVSSLI